MHFTIHTSILLPQKMYFKNIFEYHKDIFFIASINSVKDKTVF